MALDPKLYHPSEPALTTAAMVFSALVWLVLVCLVLAYGPIVALSLLVAQGLFLANVRGNGVRVSATQYPQLHEAVANATRVLGLARAPDTYVVQAGGFLNAFATRFLSRNYIVVFSDLVESCDNPRQVAFVVGHEVGHLAAGHLTWRLFLLPALGLPWLGTALRRAQEYTCDRCGHAAIGDLEDARRALAVLAAGGTLAKQMDVPAFVAQRAEAGGFFMTAFEVGSEYPFLCNRVAALENVAQPNTHPPVRRNLLGVLLAPFFGGSVLPLLIAFGVLMAMALPGFQKALERQAAAATAPAFPAATDVDFPDVPPPGDEPPQDTPPPPEDAPPRPEFFVVRTPIRGTVRGTELQVRKMGDVLAAALGELGALDDVGCDDGFCELLFVGSDADAMARALEGPLRTYARQLKGGATVRWYGDGRESLEEPR